MFAVLAVIAVAAAGKILDGFLLALGVLMCARLFGVI
jgi:hypothetical protein